MPKTITVTIEEQKITLVRPTFGGMGDTAAEVRKLYEMGDASKVLSHPSFLGLVEKACATADDFETAKGLSFVGMWDLWEAYLDFGGYEAFFTRASERQRRRQEELTERQLKASVAQVDQMKRLGILEPDFSLANEVRRDLVQAALDQSQHGATLLVDEEATTPTSPSSMTTTPAPTAGAPTK